MFERAERTKTLRTHGQQQHHSELQHELQVMANISSLCNLNITVTSCFLHFYDFVSNQAIFSVDTK